MNRLTKIWELGIVALALTLVAPSLSVAGGVDSYFFRTGEKAQPGGVWLGVQVETVDEELVSRLDLKVSEGVYVRSVVDASPAEEAGVRPGDVIVEYNYQRVRGSQELVDFVSTNDAGDEVILFINRAGKKKRLVAHLTARPVEQRPRIQPLTPPEMNKPRALHYRVNTAPYVGVLLQSISGQLADYFAAPADAGALITKVLKGSPAEEAGLKAGDVVIASDGSEVEVTEDLQRIVRGHESGDKIEVTVIRDRKRTTFTVTIAEREAQQGEFGGPRVFGFNAPFDDDSNSFGMGAHPFGADRRGRGLEPLRLPDVVYSRTREKSERIDKLERKIKELEKQIQTLRKGDSDK